MGDFNIDLLSDNQHPTLLSISDKLGLSQVVSEPTRTSSNTSTLIDHVYVSEHLTCSSCTTLPPVQGSDHNSIVLTLGKTKLIAKKHTRRKIWMYKRANFDEANTTLQCIPSFCLPANDVDSLWSQWYTFFMSTMSTFIPTKSIKPNQRLPYITDSLKRGIQRKLKLYKEAKRLNTDRAWSKYSKARNKVTANLRSAKANFFKSLASQLTSPKDFWSAYHKLSPKKLESPPT